MNGRSTTLLDVSNLALTLLGEDSITDFTTPDTEAGVKLKKWIYQAIDETQSEYLWRELVTHSELSKSTNTNYFDGRKSYALPSTCLRPIGFTIKTDSSSSSLNPILQELYGRRQGTLDYEIIGDKLITSVDADLDFVYIKREDDPSQWSSELERCCAYNIAIKGGQSITHDVGIVKNITLYFQGRIEPKARRLQSKYKSSLKFLPEHYTYINLAY